MPSALLRNATITGDPLKGCVWLGDSLYLYHKAALWPPGYSARFFPLRIYDRDGHQVWSELDLPRDIGGGFSPVGVERIPEACRTGRQAWWVVLD